ncbi:MAG: putative PEP-binding protein [Galbitalea sp.]
MAPMIDTPDEAADFAERCGAHGLTTVGVMIETPAAAVTAAEIFEHVDFVSLGTNDLAQYTMAADREVGELALLNDPWQPAVLRMMRLAFDAGAAAGKPVSVCGEAAADPMLAAVLVGLGASSLSMSPRALGHVSELLEGGHARGVPHRGGGGRGFANRPGRAGRGRRGAAHPGLRPPAREPVGAPSRSPPHRPPVARVEPV